MTHNPECGLDCVSAGAVRLDNTPSADQQTGRQHLSGDQSVEYAKHTPGPWHVGCEDRHDQPQVLSMCGELIAVVAHECVKQPPELQANARLIAAAPDMYEALKRISKATSDGLDHTRDVAVLERCIRLAQSVTAKAEGRDR
jgi:hypothetical protein